MHFQQTSKRQEEKKIRGREQQGRVIFRMTNKKQIKVKAYKILYCKQQKSQATALEFAIKMTKNMSGNIAKE